MSPCKPCVKWVGGKRASLDVIRTKLSTVNYGGFHEPFVGGGALFFSLQRDGYRRSSIGDANVKLINMYTSVRDDVTSVLEHLRTLDNNLDTYMTVRDRNFDVGTEAQRAAEFVYINKTCFNGLYRVNRAGRFNVPYGHNLKAVVCDESNLRACSEALKGSDIIVDDFETVRHRVAPGDLVYFDPPYVPVTTTSFVNYTSAGFSSMDQVRLRDLANDLRAGGVHVLLSNSSAPVIYDLYAAWNISEVDVRRSVNCVGTGRGTVKETLISSW